MKVHVHDSKVHRELPAYEHIARRWTSSSHPGRANIRKLLDFFEVTGPKGKTHIVIVMDAAQMSLRDLQVVFMPDGFDEKFVKAAIVKLLGTLDYLHTEAEVVHTGIYTGPFVLFA